MRFSAKGEYGVIAILSLGLTSNEGPVQVRTIAEKENIPIKVLEQVMNSLKNSGLVNSIRGAHGGYILAKPTEEIRLGDILFAIDGPIFSMSCVSEGKLNTCIQSDYCIVKDIWGEVKSSLMNTLNSITLKDMCDRKRIKDSKRMIMYHI